MQEEEKIETRRTLHPLIVIANETTTETRGPYEKVRHPVSASL